MDHPIAEAVGGLPVQPQRVSLISDKLVMRAFLLLLLLLPAAAAAKPFLLADVPSPGADIADMCHLSGTGGGSGYAMSGPVVVDPVNGLLANSHRVCKFDAASLPLGQNTVTMTLESTLWGVSSIPSAPFVFGKPGALLLNAPSMIRLVPE